MKKIVNIKREPFYGEIQVTAMYDDGSEEFIFGYDPHEYQIEPNELIGKTRGEAYELKNNKDLALLLG